MLKSKKEKNIGIPKYKENTQESTAVIPERFEVAILKHIISNNVATTVNNLQYPLLLGIQGPYGYGKTFMVKEVCKKYNIAIHPLSTSELSGNWEGDSRKVLKKLYESVCAENAEKNRCGVLLIDDFHLTIATEDSIGKTVNSNILSSYLMNLCDNPVVANTKTPIIMTGNNYLRIYPAIVRDGRMNLFTWKPTVEEMKPIVRQIFQAKFTGVGDESINTIMQLYEDINIAFFEQVSQDLMNSMILRAIDIFRAAKGGLTITELAETVKSGLTSIELSEELLLDFCRRRKNEILISFEEKIRIKA